MPENGQVANQPISAVVSMPPPGNAASPENLQEAMWRLQIQDKEQTGAGTEDGADDQSNNPYPDRPGEPDCTYYLKTGVCGYGTNCRYNHPNVTRHNHQQSHQQGSPYRSRNTERTDQQPDCMHFLKTGTCRYGSTCKYYHPQDKLDSPTVQLNNLGFPLRQEEKSCQYYMRTGFCKFGMACKFNHPQPTNVGNILPVPGSSPYTTMPSSLASPSGIPLAGHFPSWTPQRLAYSPGPRMQAPTAYMPIVLPTSPGVMPGQHGWATYMSTLSPMPSSDALGSGQISLSKSQPILPERPDQPECQYFMKTGNCKFGSSCKYNHPKEKQSLNGYSIGPLGLPVRPGEPVCAFYSAYGTCRYGVACRYDHPLAGYYNYNVPTFSMTDLSAFSPYTRGSQIAWTSSNSDTTFKDFKRPDGFMRFQMDNKNTESKANALEDPTSQNSPSQPAPSSEPSHNQSD